MITIIVAAALPTASTFCTAIHGRTGGTADPTSFLLALLTRGTCIVC